MMEVFAAVSVPILLAYLLCIEQSVDKLRTRLDAAESRIRALESRPIPRRGNASGSVEAVNV